MGDVISDSFIFLKQEAKPLFRLTLIYVLPFILMYAVVQVMVQQKMMSVLNMADPDSFIANMGSFYLNLFITMFFNVFVQSLYIGVAYSYIEVYIEKGRGNFNLYDITPLLFSNSLLALAINIVLFIMVMFGTMFCLVPGIYLANTFSVSIFAFILEKKGLSNALSRSWKLVNHQWWSTLWINLLGLSIILLAGIILSMPTLIGKFPSPILGMDNTSSAIEFPNWYWILSGINTVVSSLLYIIVYVFLAFQYFNLDERTKTDNIPIGE